MKKINSLLALFLLVFSVNSRAQMYTAGDISAFPSFGGSHDSTQCISTAFEMYQFTIANSFLGDSIIVKDQNTGMVMAAAENTTGQNPWNVSLNTFSMPPVVPDNQVFGGMALFNGFTMMKFISGSDTVFNVVSTFSVPVPNPCQYGNVSGKIYIDNNSDCNYNTGDDALNSVPAMAAATYTNGSNSMYGYSNATGDYTMELQQSWLTTYDVSIPSYYQFIFPSTTCSPFSYTYTTLPQSNVNFSLQCTSNIDVQCSGFGPVNVRPNIPFVLHAYVNNTGCDVASGVLKLIKDPHAVYNAGLSSNPANTVNGDTLTWNYTNLTNLTNNGYWNSFLSGVHLTPDNTVNTGDTLCFSLSATLLTADLNASNNQFTICIPVVNSYDPNIKEVSPKGIGAPGNIPITTSHLNYVIHFQNTGSAVAYNIHVDDTLDTDVDPKSLVITGSSHNMSPVWLSSNVVRFNFFGINLPDSTSNEALSHGQIAYSVKLKPSLAIGTQIKNKAQIYFDSNPAVVTNMTLNTIANPNSISNVDKDLTYTIYPNPANDFLQVVMPTILSGSNTEIAIYSTNTQLLKKQIVHTTTSTVDIHDLASGIYFIQIKNGEKSSMKKFVKE